MNQWNTLSSGITELVVSTSLNDASLNVLDLTRFKRLKKIVIGDECFMYVNELRLIGLSKLESVKIGVNSFTQRKNAAGNDPNRHFYLKNCPSLRELRIGDHSFSDYYGIEIESVDALEVIEIGGDNFDYASLVLKSILIHRE